MFHFPLPLLVWFPHPFSMYTHFSWLNLQYPYIWAHVFPSHFIASPVLYLCLLCFSVLSSWHLFLCLLPVCSCFPGSYLVWDLFTVCLFRLWITSVLLPAFCFGLLDFGFLTWTRISSSLELTFCCSTCLPIFYIWVLFDKLDNRSVSR